MQAYYIRTVTTTGHTYGAGFFLYDRVVRVIRASYGEAAPWVRGTLFGVYISKHGPFPPDYRLNQSELDFNTNVEGGVLEVTLHD